MERIGSDTAQVKLAFLINKVQKMVTGTGTTDQPMKAHGKSLLVLNPLVHQSLLEMADEQVEVIKKRTMFGISLARWYKRTNRPVPTVVRQVIGELCNCNATSGISSSDGERLSRERHLSSLCL